MGCCRQTLSPKAVLQGGGSPAGMSPLLSQGCCPGSFCWSSSLWQSCFSFTPLCRWNHTCPLVSPHQPCPVSQLPYQPRLLSLMCSSPEAVSVLGSRITSLASALTFCHTTQGRPLFIFSPRTGKSYDTFGGQEVTTLVYEAPGHSRETNSSTAFWPQQ